MKKPFNFEEVSLYKLPEQSPGFLLWHISTSWRSWIESILKPLDLTHPQFVILAALGWLTKNGDLVSQASVGKLAGLDPNTSSQIIMGLEKKHYIKREPASDSRAKNPLLTPEGNQVLAKALVAVETIDMQFFEILSDTQKEKMIKIFQKLVTQKK